MLSAEKSYSERLFLYKEIGSLSKEQSEAAIRVPAEKFDVQYTDEAIDRIVENTKGYPFFIQQLCQIVYQNTDSKSIDVTDVEQNIEEFWSHQPDNGFSRCVMNGVLLQIKFIFAMVQCGNFPVHFRMWQKSWENQSASISTARAPADQQRDYLSGTLQGT